jgi:hypothetical protein
VRQGEYAGTLHIDQKYVESCGLKEIMLDKYGFLN